VSQVKRYKEENRDIEIVDSRDRGREVTPKKSLQHLTCDSGFLIIRPDRSTGYLSQPVLSQPVTNGTNQGCGPYQTPETLKIGARP
jgi:hypothetical protein